jgi:GNAT superfamily N-acetyltransferase
METLRDGSRVTIRPIGPQDIELERRFIQELSPEARRYRFLGTIGAPSEVLLKRLTTIDDTREAALIALADEPDGPRAVGVARFSATPDGQAEVAVTVADDWRHRGLATLLMNRLAGIARSRGIRAFYSIDSAGNEPMRDLAAHLGFTRRPDSSDSTQVIYTLELTPAQG